MSDNFLGFPIIAQTKNFLITSDENTDARERASAIAGSCESDLNRLEKLFSTNFQAGDTHEYSTWVHVVAPGSGNGASNFGFEGEQSSRIIINGTFNPPLPPPPSIIPPDPLPPVPPNPAYIRQEYARFLFVAELAEILMDFTGGGWGRSDSNGEGLSIYLGTLLHPDGYYGALASPRVNAWLNADRLNQDWISIREQTDKNAVSHSCALLFIYYLVNQLGFSIEAIIAVQNSNSSFIDFWTLADTFEKLTGQPTSVAFQQFNDLIAKHLPLGQKVFVGHDNIFPLRDPSGRSVSINQSSRLMTTFRNPVPEKYDVQPGLICEIKTYDFFRVTENNEHALYAHCRGILNAAYQWKLDGAALPTHGKWDFITLPKERSVRTPDGKTKVIANSITLQYLILDSWNKSVLYIKDNQPDNGNCNFNVTASATEAAINDGFISTDDSLSINPISFDPSEQYKSDRRRCNPFYARIDNSLYGLSKTLADLKNRPDPPFEKMLLQVLEVAARVENDIQFAVRDSQLSRTELLKELRFPGALLSNELRASDEVLNLIRPNLRDEGEPMTITISATASGSLTPPTAEGKSVINGDFTINYNRYKDLSDPANPIDGRNSFTTGDGIDEETNWTFYFNEDPNFSLFSSSQPLTSALLTLTLTPKDPTDGITTDALWIETLEIIGGAAPNAPEFQSLPSDVTATIQIELLDRLPSYTSTAILGILFSSMGGRISMRYQDDAIISFAQLDLTQESL